MAREWRDRRATRGVAALSAVLFLSAATMARGEDAALLSDCLDRVAEAQAVTGERLFDPTACTGSVEFLCAELGGEDCAGREAVAWRGLAEEALGALEDASVDQATAAAVRGAQAEWEAWMAADCRLVAPFTESAALLGLAEAACRRDAWAARAITLRARAANIF